MARPGGAKWLRTESNLGWIGQPFLDLIPRVFPRAWRLCEPETHPELWGCGASLSAGHPSTLLCRLSERIRGVLCVVSVGAAPLTMRYIVLPLDE